tara:strand:+ start:833 stop:1714 length:882 start_codon:yes stop_codon:yes gene_type:complete
MILFPDISPEIFSIDIGGFEFALRWYALSYILGIFLGWRLAVIVSRTAGLWPKNQSPIKPIQTEDLMTWIVFGVIIGGRLGYVIFYEPNKYLDDLGSILKIWQGGMSFHGGFLGVVLTAYFFFKRYLVPYASGADLLALCTPVGLLLGRIANFINAELWGRATDMPWGVAFPGEVAQACGQISGLCARHPSQLYEALLEGLILGGVLVYVAFRRNGLKRPGLITGMFFTGYGTARYFVEFFRQPDFQFQSATNPIGYAFQFGDYGITMGQALSSPMIVLGLALILTAIRRSAI